MYVVIIHIQKFKYIWTLLIVSWKVYTYHRILKHLQNNLMHLTNLEVIQCDDHSCLLEMVWYFIMHSLNSIAPKLNIKLGVAGDSSFKEQDVWKMCLRYPRMLHNVAFLNWDSDDGKILLKMFGTNILFA